VLQLDDIDSDAAVGSSAAAAAAVKQSYRRLAGLVHPDKCDLPLATEAFQALAAACQEAAQQLGPGPGAGAAAGGAEAAAGSAGSGAWGAADVDAWWHAWEDLGAKVGLCAGCCMVAAGVLYDGCTAHSMPGRGLRVGS
jgi:hypothetical protein